MKEVSERKDLRRDSRIKELEEEVNALKKHKLKDTQKLQKKTEEERAINIEQ